VEQSAQLQGLAAYALTSQSWFFARLGQIDKHVSCLERSRAAVQQYGTAYEIALHCHLYASSRADQEEAQALFERSLAFFRTVGATWDVAFVINGRGNFAFGRGETLKARELYAEALALWQASGELQGTANGLLNLGRVAYALGDYDRSRRLLQESLAMQQAVGSKIRTAECLEVLGAVACAQGQFAEAEARFRQQIAILRDLGNRELRSWSCSHLGAAVLAQDRLGEAATLLAEALAIAEECEDQRGRARAHNQLGWLTLRQGAPETARQHWRTTVDLAWRIQDRAHLLITLDALIGLATLMAEAGDGEQATTLLALVQSAARIDRHTQTRAEQSLAELEARLPADRFAAAQARGRARELGAAVAALLAEDVW
jgi:tetratricopeptide (TPR) repeat protein